MKVLLYDLRGHGLSERPSSGYGLTTMSDDLMCVIRKHEIKRATLIGHSFGAVLALKFAIEHPEAVERLVLVETTLPLSSPVWIEALSASSEETVLNLFPPTQRAILRQGGRRSDRLINQIVSLGQKTSLIDDLKEAADFADSEIAGVTCPVLLCNGANAADFTGETRERLASLLPNVTVKVFDAGHNLPLEMPQALTDAIRDFVIG